MSTNRPQTTSPARTGSASAALAKAQAYLRGEKPSSLRGSASPSRKNSADDRLGLPGSKKGSQSSISSGRHSRTKRDDHEGSSSGDDDDDDNELKNYLKTLATKKLSGASASSTPGTGTPDRKHSAGSGITGSSYMKKSPLSSPVKMDLESRVGPVSGIPLSPSTSLNIPKTATSLKAQKSFTALKREDGRNITGSLELRRKAVTSLGSMNIETDSDTDDDDDDDNSQNRDPLIKPSSPTKTELTKGLMSKSSPSIGFLNQGAKMDSKSVVGSNPNIGQQKPASGLGDMESLASEDNDNDDDSKQHYLKKKEAVKGKGQYIKSGNTSPTKFGSTKTPSESDSSEDVPRARHSYLKKPSTAFSVSSESVSSFNTSGTPSTVKAASLEVKPDVTKESHFSSKPNASSPLKGSSLKYSEDIGSDNSDSDSSIGSNFDAFLLRKKGNSSKDAVEKASNEDVKPSSAGGNSGMAVSQTNATTSNVAGTPPPPSKSLAAMAADKKPTTTTTTNNITISKPKATSVSEFATAMKSILSRNASPAFGTVKTFEDLEKENEDNITSLIEEKISKTEDLEEDIEEELVSKEDPSSIVEDIPKTRFDDLLTVEDLELGAKREETSALGTKANSSRSQPVHKPIAVHAQAPPPPRATTSGPSATTSAYQQQPATSVPSNSNPHPHYYQTPHAPPSSQVPPLYPHPAGSTISYPSYPYPPPAWMYPPYYPPFHTPWTASVAADTTLQNPPSFAQNSSGGEDSGKCNGDHVCGCRPRHFWEEKGMLCSKCKSKLSKRHKHKHHKKHRKHQHSEKKEEEKKKEKRSKHKEDTKGKGKEKSEAADTQSSSSYESLSEHQYPRPQFESSPFSFATPHLTSISPFAPMSILQSHLQLLQELQNLNQVLKFEEQGLRRMKYTTLKETKEELERRRKGKEMSFEEALEAVKAEEGRL
ncbi:hypothetical protein HDV05_004389 [Chytridiales sp. JEL 0842]|nr:hypothetical protein HDV05_004389 [Chytridiales sp. JEL 0842]